MIIPTQQKPYKIAFEDYGDHLHARIEGEADSYEISQMYWAEIAAECEKRGTKKLFVEERLEQQIPSIADTYQTAAERHEMGLAGIKIAFYDAIADQLDQNQFGELVARNRGVNVKVFDDTAAALAWLLSDEAVNLPEADQQ
jgi:hypothetical protein